MTYGQQELNLGLTSTVHFVLHDCCCELTDGRLDAHGRAVGSGFFSLASLPDNVPSFSILPILTFGRGKVKGKIREN